MHIIHTSKFVSTKARVCGIPRALTEEEIEVRRISYALKIPTEEACLVAADAMAKALLPELSDAQIYFIPVPNSVGSVEANRMLAKAIAECLYRQYRTEELPRVKIAVGRKHPVESSCARRRSGKAGLAVDEHAMVRVTGPLPANARYYFIDNVVATGNTLQACVDALGFGDGLVYART